MSEDAKKIALKAKLDAMKKQKAEREAQQNSEQPKPLVLNALQNPAEIMKIQQQLMKSRSAQKQQKQDSLKKQAEGAKQRQSDPFQQEIAEQKKLDEQHRISREAIELKKKQEEELKR